METMDDVKRLKYNMLTLGNALRGYYNVNAVDDIERLEGELERLENTYNHCVLNNRIKDEYVISELTNIVWTVDDDELNELLEDHPDEAYYSDASMSWIYDAIYELFVDDETLKDIDDRVATLFGHYSYNHIVKNGSQYYIIFEW